MPFSKNLMFDYLDRFLGVGQAQNFSVTVCMCVKQNFKVHMLCFYSFLCFGNFGKCMFIICNLLFPRYFLFEETYSLNINVTKLKLADWI